MIYRSPYPDVDIPNVTLQDHLFEHAAKYTDKPALIDGPTGRTMTYGQLVEAVRRTAAGLAARGFGKGDVFALAGGTVQPKDVGIATTLNPEVTRSYADFELSERNTQEDRDHDLNIEDAKTSGAMTIELWKVLLMIAGAIALTLLGVKTLG